MRNEGIQDPLTQNAECALNRVRFRAAMYPTWCMADWGMEKGLKILTVEMRNKETRILPGSSSILRRVGEEGQTFN